METWRVAIVLFSASKQQLEERLEINSNKISRKMDLEVKLLSLNINGLNSKIKRQRTFARLIKQKVDIVCLQETHMLRAEENCLE
ncbi:hypothetical protein E2320_014137, partial [Naja naja]